MPQDVKLSPDGQTFYVAEMMAGGVYLIDRTGRKKIGFIRTAPGHTDSTGAETLGTSTSRTAAPAP